MTGLLSGKHTVRIREAHTHEARSIYLLAEPERTADGLVMDAMRYAQERGYGIGTCRVEIYPGHDGYYTAAEQIACGTANREAATGRCAVDVG